MIFCCCCWFITLLCFLFRTQRDFQIYNGQVQTMFMAHVPVCVYLIVWLTRLNCVGGSSDASSATNWQPNTGARTNTHTHTYTYYAFLRLRFQFDFRKFQQQQQQHLRFACFRLFQTCSLCYIFCLFYVCLRRHTHTLTHAHIHGHGCCSARFAAGILRAFCSCAASAAPATRLLQRQTEATRQQQQQHQLQQQQQLAHAPTVLLSLVPII